MAAKKPEIVVFDLGKVLLDFDYQLAVSNIGARCKRKECDINSLINQSPLLYEMESGRTSSSDFFLQVQEAAGFEGNEKEFGELFGNIFEEIPPMIAAQKKLMQSGIPTYIFSNTNGIAIQYISKTFPFFGGFTGYIYSHEAGAMKPQPAIYAALEKLAGKSGSQIAYLDDRVENVEAGLDRGWQAHLHETPEGSRKFLRSLGLLK